jgi:hypothetical protein
VAPSPSTATWYDPKSNTVFINKAFDNEQAAQAFVHEMTHADFAKTGRTANVSALKNTRPDYIEKMCREEATAEANAIKHKFQSQSKAGKPIHASSPVEQVYSDAFAAEAQRLRAASPGMDEAIIRMRAEIVAENSVYKAFMDGRVTNSITKESYVKYYGDEWDAANATLRLPHFPMPPD